MNPNDENDSAAWTNVGFGSGFLRAGADSSSATTANPAAAASTAITDADVKGISSPDAKARANGDPDGSLTGNVSDIAVADPITDKTPKAKGLTIGDIANQIGQNKIAINFVWTLVTGFLVMFMQAGFAIVETGLCRAKNANHTMMMNFMVYGVGMLAYWLIGFAIQEGGVGAVLNLGNSPVLSESLWSRSSASLSDYGGKAVTS